MSLDDRDAAYLWDMLQAAEEARSMLEKIELDDFIDNRILQRAVERVLEIIGESARRVSLPGRDTANDIQWRLIIGQRNILAHEYGQIDHEVLYASVIEDIPVLIKQLEAALPPLENE
jgi:uncharacterized protein with HEPN domain